MHIFNRKEKILLYSNNVWYLAEGMLGPLFALFAADIGGNILSISWAWAAYLIVSGVMVMIIGILCDRGLNRERVLVAGFFLNSITSFSYLLVSNTTQLFFVQALLGLATAMTIPTWYSLYAKYENRLHDAITWGTAKGEAMLITGLAILIGGVVSSQFGFDTLFIIMGTVQLVAAVMMTRILKK